MDEGRGLVLPMVALKTLPGRRRPLVPTVRKRRPVRAVRPATSSPTAATQGRA